MTVRTSVTYVHSGPLHALSLSLMQFDLSDTRETFGLPKVALNLLQRPFGLPKLSGGVSVASVKNRIWFLITWDITTVQMDAARTDLLDGEVDQLKQQLHERGRSSEKLATLRTLNNDALLDLIFTFVGINEFLFVGGICRRWYRRYVGMCSEARRSADVAARKTLHSTSIVTTARFKLALDCGLCIRSEDEQTATKPYFDDLPKFSSDPIGILTLARQRGAAWHSIMSSDAALYGSFELLEWLHESGCPCSAETVTVHLMRSSRSAERRLITMQHWLQRLPSDFAERQSLMNELLFEAGLSKSFKAAEYLLSEGAEWPVNFSMPDACTTKHDFMERWPVESAEWALSRGYSWQGWLCQVVALNEAIQHSDRAAADALFGWTHSSQVNCPCTCHDSVGFTVHNISKHRFYSALAAAGLLNLGS
jgi:hypothetical protein